MDEIVTDILSQRAYAMVSLAAAVDNTKDDRAQELLLEFMRRTTLLVVLPQAQIIPFPGRPANDNEESDD